MTYPTSITVCGGKYTILYNLETGQSECLRYGEKWRELSGDKMIMAMFDEIVELRIAIRAFITAWDLQSDPTAVGATCQLIRAESELRTLSKRS